MGACRRKLHVQTQFLCLFRCFLLRVTPLYQTQNRLGWDPCSCSQRGVTGCRRKGQRGETPLRFGQGHGKGWLQRVRPAPR